MNVLCSESKDHTYSQRPLPEAPQKSSWQKTPEFDSHANLSLLYFEALRTVEETQAYTEPK